MKHRLQNIRKLPGFLAGLVAVLLSAVGLKAAQAQSINCVSPLNFGSLASCAGTGTITLSPTGSLSTTGCVTTYGASEAVGRCIIQGQFFPVRPVQASVANATVTLSNGTTTMKVTSFDVEASGNGPVTTQTTFLFTLDIGGTLNVGASQAEGTYTGSMTINANYL